jgi:hypothetical protein
MNRSGFSLYLTFIVTTVVFILVSGSYEIGRISLDMSRSSALEAVVFHGADGGLERGLGMLRKNFAEFNFSYRSQLSLNRILEVNVFSKRKGDQMNLYATATLFEGKNQVARRHLSRQSIENKPGRNGVGNFMEAS